MGGAAMLGGRIGTAPTKRLAAPVTKPRRLPPSQQAAVERLRAELARHLAAKATEAPHLCSVTLDWWLWEEGERNISAHRPHHRTLTIYY